jgi:hypothetical protein
VRQGGGRQQVATLDAVALATGPQARVRQIVIG